VVIINTVILQFQCFIIGNFFPSAKPFEALSDAYFEGILWLLFGLSGIRSFDKWRGTAR
jgi:hypothetical protein